MGNKTKVKLSVGDKTVSATLNDTISAQDLISKLPYSVSVHRAAFDYCGRLDSPLKYVESERQRGWKNGDISYVPGDDWIAFFFDGEDESSSDNNPQHIIGSVDYVDELFSLPAGNIEIKIEKI